MKAVKVGDIGTEHDGFHPTKVTAGSPNVFIDGKPAARVGDPLEPHDKPKHPKHSREIASGSSTVFINGKPAALTGGGVDCGGITIGSGTVNIGDKTSSKPFVPPVSFDEKVRLLTPEGAPIANSPFFIKLKNGKEYKGLSDDNGFLPRIYTDQKEGLEVLLGVHALEWWGSNE
jgi:uncharacterized Zn-binding protein involved in type VI secretion